MISLVDNGTKFAPHLMCDVCQKPITETGNIEWYLDADFKPTGPLLMAHKECSRYIRRDGNRPDSWMPLGWFLSHLVENAQVKWSITENYIWLPDTHTALPQVQEQLRENDRYRQAVPLVIEAIEDTRSRR